jgi:hypothetical protein
VLAVNWKQQAVFTALASIAVALIYLAYLGVTAPLLVRRLRRGGLRPGDAEDARPRFSLGGLGLPVTVLAVVYQVGMVANLLWPRRAVYDLTGHTWWLRFSAWLFLALVLAVGGALHLRTRTRHGDIELDPIPASGAPDEAA